MKIATLNVFKIFVICVLLLIPTGSNNELHNDDDNLIKVGQVTNEIRMGKFAGNRNLAIGVRNILEELLLDLDYDLSDQASTQVNVRLVFFDIKDIGTNIGILHRDVALTQIIAIGELVKNGKVKKRTTQKGVSKTISTSTLVVADDGTFNQQTASIALKKLCENIIKRFIMRKLLFLLLLPVTLFGQDLTLDHSYTDSAPFVVGDTITVKFNTLSDDNKGVYFIMFDYQYNNKLLEKIDHTFKLPDNQSASKSLNHWDGYSFNPLTQYAGVAQSVADLDFQYYQGWLNAGNSSYSQVNDWSVERIIVQESSTAISHSETILEVRFRVKDRQGTGYDDYTEVTRLSWMKATDNTSTADDNLYDVGVGPSGQKLNIENQGAVTGVDAGAVTIKLNSAAKAQIMLLIFLMLFMLLME